MIAWVLWAACVLVWGAIIRAAMQAERAAAAIRRRQLDDRELRIAESETRQRAERAAAAIRAGQLDAWERRIADRDNRADAATPNMR